MILLTSVSDLITVTTGSAGTINVHASYVDFNGTLVVPARTNTATISTATTTTVVAAPASSTQRNLKFLSIFNSHATVSNLVTIQHTDGTNVETLWRGTLLAGETVTLDDEAEWHNYNSAGVEELAVASPLTTKGDLFGFDTVATRIPVGTGGLALFANPNAVGGVSYAAPVLTNYSTSTVSAAFATDTYLTGSGLTIPAGLVKAGTTIKWVFDIVKTAAGVATPIINIRFGVNNTVADASICAFTFAAGTAVADTGKFEIVAHFRTVGSGTTAVLVGTASCNHALAATGLTTTGASGYGQITTVGGGFNSTVASSFISLSFNGGTSFSGTNNLVQVQAYNLNV